jgi:hypothetical protein
LRIGALLADRQLDVVTLSGTALLTALGLEKSNY